MNTPVSKPASSRATVRTIIVRISRKLRATYRVYTGPRFSTVLAALVTAIMPMTARALPQGGTVQAGSATIATSSNSVVVKQATDKAVLDWRSFNIGGSESVQFQ